MKKDISKKQPLARDRFSLQMGNCLLAWQDLEEQLFDLFFVATDMSNIHVCSAVFTAVINISAKANLTDIAIKAALTTKEINDPAKIKKGVEISKEKKQLLVKWTDLYSAISSNSSMRNKVAHNLLLPPLNPAEGVNGYALFPHPYKMFYGFEPKKFFQQQINYKKLQEIEKESKRIKNEMSQFRHKLEEVLENEFS